MKRLPELAFIWKAYGLTLETVCSARSYFNTGLEDYLYFPDQLQADAQVLHDPHLKSTAIKMQERDECVLNITDKSQ